VFQYGVIDQGSGELQKSPALYQGDPVLDYLAAGEFPKGLLWGHTCFQPILSRPVNVWLEAHQQSPFPARPGQSQQSQLLHDIDPGRSPFQLEYLAAGGNVQGHLQETVVPLPAIPGRYAQ